MSLVTTIKDIIRTRFLSAKKTGEIITVTEKLRYNDSFSFDEDLDIPSKAYVEYLIGLKTVISKTGADVDGNGDLDLSGETIPANPKTTVYINDIEGSYQTQYNKSTKVLSGLYGIEPGDIIDIIF